MTASSLRGWSSVGTDGAHRTRLFRRGKVPVAWRRQMRAAVGGPGAEFREKVVVGGSTSKMWPGCSQACRPSLRRRPSRQPGPSEPVLRHVLCSPSPRPLSSSFNACWVMARPHVSHFQKAPVECRVLVWQRGQVSRTRVRVLAKADIGNDTSVLSYEASDLEASAKQPYLATTSAYSKAISIPL